MNPPVINYRISHFLYYHQMKHLSRLIDWIGRFLWGCFVPGQARIGKNLQLSYWGIGVVVHVRTLIGENCHIGQNVTIGGGHGGGVPKIGNNVRIGGGGVLFSMV